MHEIIAYGVDSQLFRDGPYGPKVNAIGWLCYNGSCKGEQMLYLDRGQIVARKGPGVQGHYGQFLAILAQSRLPIDYPMLISGKTFTIGDLVEHEKLDCQPGEELTFKLIGLMHYLDSDATWTSRYGEPWSISRLITEELRQPIRGAACGGTHRLMGFSYAVNKRIHRGKEVTGEFARRRSSSTNITATPSACRMPTAVSAPSGSPAVRPIRMSIAGCARPGISPNGSLFRSPTTTSAAHRWSKPWTIWRRSCFPTAVVNGRSGRSGTDCTRWPCMTAGCL